MEGLEDVLKYLQIGARLDLKAVALENVLGLTGTKEGIKVLIEHPSLVFSLITLLYDSNGTISKDAALSLVNISADEDGACKLVELDLEAFQTRPPLQNLPRKPTDTFIKFVLDKDSLIADPCCMILSNVTRTKRLVEPVVDSIKEHFDHLVKAFNTVNYNTKGCNLHYVAPLLANLAQSGRFRQKLLDEKCGYVQKLLTFFDFEGSLIRRGGIAGLIKNVTFDHNCHEWLLSEDVDVLPWLLLPLAGNEEYDEEDNDKLPLELQYLPETKHREEDPDIRIILLEALLQLCAKRPNREYIRGKNSYVILRDLHKWETDKRVLLACENVIDILIRTEEEIGEENLKELDVPDDMKEKFKKMDEEYLEN